MNERNLERPTSNELEPKPKVLVTFHGINHHTLNFEGLRHTKESLERHLLQSRGTTTVFLEAAESSKSLADRFKKDINAFGGIGTYGSAVVLSIRNRREPTLAEALAHKNTITRTDLDTVINSGLIPIDALEDYYSRLALDELSQSHDLEFDHETHSKTVIDKGTQISRVSLDLRRQTSEQWNDGNFNHVTEIWKKYCQIDVLLSKTREAEMVEDLKFRIRKMAKHPEGGSLFLIFGWAHSPMMQALERKMGPKAPVKFVTDTDYSDETIFSNIFSSLRNGVDVPDESYAQEIFHKKLFESTFIYFIEYSKISAFAYNFETIERILNKLALQTSLEEIRRICEEKVDLLEYVKKSPVGQDALEIANQNPQSKKWIPGSSTKL